MCVMIGVFTAGVSWFIYWLTLGEMFQSGIHPDYWPASLICAVWILATITGLTAALIFFRTSLGRRGR
jgi:hypothetical protein